METFICNKCFATTHRGKKPFCLTQCGHIYCNGCIKQGIHEIELDDVRNANINAIELGSCKEEYKSEKQCTQCQQLDIFSVELQQPSLSRVENFFAPLNESLESLHKICGFQNNQMKIMIQRFHEIDKKYETLKAHYCNLTQSMKLLKDKYIKLKMEYTEQRKKFVSMEMHNRTLNMSDISTPMNPNIKRNKTRNTSNSYFSSYGTNLSCQSFNVGKEHTMLEGFRIPQSVKSVSSRGTSDTNSTYTFRP